MMKRETNFGESENTKKLRHNEGFELANLCILDGHFSNWDGAAVNSPRQRRYEILTHT